MAKLALPFHFTSISPSRIAQKDFQSRKREIEYMPLENCPFLMTAHFQSLISMWLCFLPNKEWRLSGEHELICCPPCLQMGLRNARNLESGIRNLSNTHLLEHSFFICRKSLHIYNICFIFGYTDVEQNV